MTAGFFAALGCAVKERTAVGAATTVEREPAPRPAPGLRRGAGGRNPGSDRGNQYSHRGDHGACSQPEWPRHLYGRNDLAPVAGHSRVLRTGAARWYSGCETSRRGRVRVAVGGLLLGAAQSLLAIGVGLVLVPQLMGRQYTSATVSLARICLVSTLVNSTYMLIKQSFAGIGAFRPFNLANLWPQLLYLIALW